MRSLRWIAALVTTVGVALLLFMPDRAVVAQRAPRPVVDVANLEVFYTAPMLVRAGEAVEIPVDVVCAAADGSACSATAVLSLREQGAGWRSFRAPAGPGVGFDVSAPLGRAMASVTGSGSVAFRIAAQAGEGAAITPTQTPGRSPTLHMYVTDDLPTIRVPAVRFERARSGREVLFLPWGTGPRRAGLRPGNESPTLGPSSFDVGRRGAIMLVDSLQGRVAEFHRGHLVRQVRLGGSSSAHAWADIAVARDGSIHLASRAAGSPWRGIVRAVGRDGEVHILTKRLPGMPSEIAVAGGSTFVRVLPLDAWVPAAGRSATLGGEPTMGKPTGRTSQILASGTDDRIRIGTVARGRVRRAVELVPTGSGVRFGEVALAEPDGAGGFTVVVHVRRGGQQATDRYLVVRVDRSLGLRTFLVPARTYATSMALSRFRSGPDGALYQMRTEPDGVHIVRYGLGGRSA